MAAVTKNRNFFNCPLLRQQWTIEEISIFSNSSHLEWKVGLSDTVLKGTHPGIEMSSLTYIPGFSVKFFFQPIYTDYAN
jgi:hypothetical protein